MRIAPITAGLTLALSLAACSGPVRLAQAPAEQKADETVQVTSDEPAHTDEVGEPAIEGDATADGASTDAAADEADGASTDAGTSATTDAGAATADAKREFTMDTPREGTSVTDAVEDIVASGSLLFAQVEWPQCEATDGIPVPTFSVPVETVSMNEDAYSSGATGTWYDVPESEVVDYLKSLRDAGFVFGTSVSRSTDSFSYTASDTDDDSYATSRRSVSLNYYQPYDEDERDHDYTLDISVWLSRDDSGLVTYDVSDNARAEDPAAI